MSLPLLRGRELKSPSRPERSTPAAGKTEVNQLPRIGKARKGKPVLRFPVGAETQAFYRRFYPGTSSADWNDWHWQ